MRKELLKGLTEEQKKKVAECNNAEEILALAKAEGVALNDEQLEAVSGGCLDFLEPGSDDWGFSCPKCKSDDTTYTYNEPKPGFNYTCHKCGHKWIP